MKTQFLFILAPFVFLQFTLPQYALGAETAPLQTLTSHQAGGNYVPPPELMELSWLAGNWLDQDENIDITYRVKWALSKTFLIQHFIVKHEQGNLKGMQIIGWDPLKKQIRSWIFDSEGGYGESLWSKEGDTWYSPVVFTRSDGGQVTATHIYRKIDDNSYSFSSVVREIDGKVLPNIGPFTVVRKNEPS
jgi:hypothetical protein